MVVDLSAVDDTQVSPDDVQIFEVEDLIGLRRWAELMTSVYAFPEFARPLWFELHAALGLGSNQLWRHFLAVYRGQPAATASLFAGRQSAAVANVATLPEYRRIGLGRSITLATLRAAVRANYRIGTLYSSPAAASIYRALGFHEVCHAECFSWAPE